jgi:hypothetical protein
MGSTPSKEELDADLIKRYTREIARYEIEIIRASNMHLTHVKEDHDRNCNYNCLSREMEIKKYAMEQISHFEERIKLLKNNVDTTIQYTPDAPPKYDDYQ